MHYLYCFLLVVLFSQAHGFFMSRKKTCDYNKYENKAIACLLQYESAFKSNIQKDLCKAYKAAKNCMLPLVELNKKCGHLAPTDVYNSFERWTDLHAKKTCVQI